MPFKEILSEEMLSKAFTHVKYRDGVYTPDVTTACLLSQALDEDQSLQGSVLRIIANKIENNEEPPSANTSAYSQARTRLPKQVLEDLSEQVADDTIQKVAPEWKWRGRDTRLIDGSTLSMPDTPANQEQFPQPKSQKKGVGFPLARFVVIICFMTGVVLKFAMESFSGKETGEHALLRQMMDTFKSGDVVLGDGYYPSYFLVCELIQRGVDFVFPAHSARHVDFSNGKRLGKKDHTVLWSKPLKPAWMEQEKYDNYAESVEIREVEITMDRRGFRSKKRTLVTSFLDPIEVSKIDLSKLYGLRWFVELDIRSIKSVMKMDVLRSKTPAMIEKEIASRLLAYNIVRRIMVDAAKKASKRPRQLSFKTALRAIEIFSQKGLISTENGSAYHVLLESIAHKEVGNRPGRYEPRMIKRRPKPQKRLQKPRDFYKNPAHWEVA